MWCGMYDSKNCFMNFCCSRKILCFVAVLIVVGCCFPLCYCNNNISSYPAGYTSGVVCKLAQKENYNGKSIIAIIPARAGSVSVKNKNIYPLAGKPLVAWTIEAARKSKYLTDFVVSTNGKEIKECAMKYGSDVIDRPEEISGSTAKTESAVMHALHYLKNIEGKTFDYVMILQPTCPLRTAEDIDGIIKMVIDRNLKSALSVKKVTNHPILMRFCAKDNKLTKIMNCRSNVRRQDMPTAYYVSGVLYLFDLKRNNEIVINEAEHGYIMDEERSTDIDTYDDIRAIESYLAKRRKLAKVTNAKQQRW